jgi:hypothetical protein
VYILRSGTSHEIETGYHRRAELGDQRNCYLRYFVIRVYVIYRPARLLIIVLRRRGGVSLYRTQIHKQGGISRPSKSDLQIKAKGLEAHLEPLKELNAKHGEKKGHLKADLGSTRKRKQYPTKGTNEHFKAVSWVGGSGITPRFGWSPI